MSQYLILRCLLLTVAAGNVFLHGIGLSLLLILNKRDQDDSQTLFLINVACSELICNILLVVRDIIEIAMQSGYMSTTLMSLFFCLNFALATGISYLTIMAMFYITGDRLLHILLHLRYSQYLNVEKTRQLLFCTWFLNMTISFVFSLLTYVDVNFVFKQAHLGKVFTAYVANILHLAYFVFAIFTYLAMFRVYARTERNKYPRSSMFTIFVKSRFFVSIVLIGGYLVLTVFPNLARAIIWLNSNSAGLEYAMSMYFHFSTRLSQTVDGLIYIFLKKTVRYLLWKKLGLRNVATQNSSAANTSFIITPADSNNDAEAETAL